MNDIIQINVHIDSSTYRILVGNTIIKEERVIAKGDREERWHQIMTVATSEVDRLFPTENLHSELGR